MCVTPDLPKTVYYSMARDPSFCASCTASPPMPRASMIEIQYVANLSPLPYDNFPHQQAMTEAGAVILFPPLTAF